MTTLPPDALDLHGLARALGRSYGWTAANWRDLPGFPPPYMGGHPRGRPRWHRAVIEDYKRGVRFAASAPAARPPSAMAANDLVTVTPDRVSALIAGLQ